MSDEPTSEAIAPRAAVRAVRVTKTYGSGDATVTALRSVDVEIYAGEFTAVMGPSGSGKSTLMHCCAALDTVTSGSVFVGETELNRLGDKELTRLRRDEIGFVFQSFNLVPTLTAEENILLPLSIAGRRPDADWYGTVVDTVALRDRLGHRPNQLSGGQQQRVAVARALVSRPSVVFADEPTGNLDTRTSREIMAFFRELNRAEGLTVILVTHDLEIARRARRALVLVDGEVVADTTDFDLAAETLHRRAALADEAGPGSTG